MEKKSSSLGKFIGFLLVLYVVLAALDAMGLFVMGNYYSYENGELDMESFTTISFYGKTSDDEADGEITYILKGNEISFYMDEIKIVEAEISNGVMKMTGWFGGEDYACKEGKTPEDMDEKGVIDYLRMILNPLSEIFSKLLYD